MKFTVRRKKIDLELEYEHIEHVLIFTYKTGLFFKIGIKEKNVKAPWQK